MGYLHRIDFGQTDINQLPGFVEAFAEQDFDAMADILVKGVTDDDGSVHLNDYGQKCFAEALNQVAAELGDRNPHEQRGITEHIIQRFRRYAESALDGSDVPLDLNLRNPRAFRDAIREYLAGTAEGPR